MLPALQICIVLAMDGLVNGSVLCSPLHENLMRPSGTQQQRRFQAFGGHILAGRLLTPPFSVQSSKLIVSSQSTMDSAVYSHYRHAYALISRDIIWP